MLTFNAKVEMRSETLDVQVPRRATGFALIRLAVDAEEHYRLLRTHLTH